MSFTSMAYLVFVASCALLYYCLPKKYQWYVLLIFSYIFYLLAGPKMVLFLLLTTFSTYIGGLALERNAKKADLSNDQKKHRARGIISACLIINFGVLFILKYLNFSVEVLNTVFSTDFSIQKMILPLGISFYTFQTVSYLIDVYWEKCEAEHSLLKYMLFASFFPQILQGPIGRYNRLAGQYNQYHTFNLLTVEHGLQRMLWGYFQKFILADRAGVVVQKVVSEYEEYKGAVFVFMILMYSIQLYTDFSGGMDVVIGTAEIFGISLDENFKRPYFAVSIADFWHRWHITLGTWMKDYVFYPLSLSALMRKMGKKIKKRFGRRMGVAIPAAICNILVFLIVGVWHGAGGKYLIYGLFNGLIIGMAELCGPINRSLLNKCKLEPGSAPVRIYRIVLTFILVNFSWYFDIATDLKCSFYMLKETFASFHFADLSAENILLLGLGWKDYVCLIFGCVILFAVSLLKEKGYQIRELLDKSNIIIRWCLYYGLILSILVLGKYTNGGFIYAQF